MIAELLECCDLRSNGNVIPKDLHFVRLALNGEPARPGRLKSDEQHQIPWIGKPLREVMQDAPSSHHATGRNDDHRHHGLIDPLRLFRSRSKRESWPLQRRAILPYHVAGLVAVFFVVLQENLDCLDGHGAVAKNRQAWNLLRLHQMLEDENKFLGALNRSEERRVG